MQGENAFGWFTGIADIALTCPPGLAAEGGLVRFFCGPNEEDFGTELPRLLMHEVLHAFQLVSSRWLQRMVAEEWERVLQFERDGAAPPIGPLRRSFGRAPADAPFSVRDLVECLARFWDVHSRSPARMLKEEGDDLGGLVAVIDAQRARLGHTGYSHIEFDAIMTGGRDAAIYAAPYRWMLDRARESAFLREFTAKNPDQLGPAASFAVGLAFPMAGFIALNTTDPLRAFLRVFERSLDRDMLMGAIAQRNPWRSINLDWLACWPVVVDGYVRILCREGLRPNVTVGPIGHAGWDEHPVWRHVLERFAVLKRGLFRMLMSPDPPGYEDGRPWRGAERKLEEQLFLHSAFAACGLPGHPDYRLRLGMAFLPPILRFADRTLAGGESAAGFTPWAEDTETVAEAALDAERRHARLRAADAEREFGLPPGSFARRAA